MRVASDGEFKAQDDAKHPGSTGKGSTGSSSAKGSSNKGSSKGSSKGSTDGDAASRASESIDGSQPLLEGPRAASESLLEFAGDWWEDDPNPHRGSASFVRTLLSVPEQVETYAKHVLGDSADAHQIGLPRKYLQQAAKEEAELCVEKALKIVQSIPAEVRKQALRDAELAGILTGGWSRPWSPMGPLQPPPRGPPEPSRPVLGVPGGAQELRHGWAREQRERLSEVLLGPRSEAENSSTKAEGSSNVDSVDSHGRLGSAGSQKSHPSGEDASRRQDKSSDSQAAAGSRTGDSSHQEGSRTGSSGTEDHAQEGAKAKKKAKRKGFSANEVELMFT